MIKFNSINKLNEMFQKQGGKLLIEQYKYSGVLGYAIRMFPLLSNSKTKLEIFRDVVENKIHENIEKKYKNYHFQKNCDDTMIKKNLGKSPIWFMWLQGIDEAPELVKNNYDILSKICGANDIKLVSLKNLDQYIELPEFIIEKWNKGIISNTHLSDLIRLELLNRYGGIWIDSTVMPTCDKIPDYLTESDFFVPQILKPGRDGKAIYISSWLMAGKKNNVVIRNTLDILYEYWKNNDFLMDYFLVHHFLELMIKNEYDDKAITPIDNGQMHSVLISITKKNMDVESTVNQMKFSDFQKLSNKTTRVQNNRLLGLQKFRLGELNAK